MPRPKGWKPLNYTTIATICAKLCLGLGRNQVAREMGVPKETVGHLRNVLCAAGAVPHKERRKFPPAIDQEIHRLVRTTMLTNQQIKRRLGLNCTSAVLARRKTFHDGLRARGEPVPLCRCGDEFQHAHVCPFKGQGPKPLDPGDTEDAIRDLEAGFSLEELRTRFSISTRAATRLLRSLTARQLQRRRKAISAQRIAAGRRNRHGSNFDGLYERLDEAIPKRIPAEVRSEMLQDMALQILNGDVVEQHAIKQLRSFSSKAFRRLGDSWRTVSIDAATDGVRLADMIEDAGALAEFSALDELALAD